MYQGTMPYLSEFLDLESGAADDASGLALVNEHAQFAVEVHVLVLLILARNKSHMITPGLYVWA